MLSYCRRPGLGPHHRRAGAALRRRSRRVRQTACWLNGDISPLIRARCVVRHQGPIPGNIYFHIFSGVRLRFVVGVAGGGRVSKARTLVSFLKRARVMRTRSPGRGGRRDGVSASGRRRATSPPRPRSRSARRPRLDLGCGRWARSHAGRSTVADRRPSAALHMYVSGAPSCAPSAPLIRKYCAFLSDRRISYPGPGSPAHQALLRNIYGLPVLGGMAALRGEPCCRIATNVA